MRLVLKQNGQLLNEFQFAVSPVYIGRQENSQVFLQDKGVSRHHAVLFNTQDGKWILEDLDSTNKTFLNDKEIHKAEIKSGDVLRIAAFVIEVTLDNSTAPSEKSGHSEDTHSATVHGLDDTQTATCQEAEIVVRRLDLETGAELKLPARRAKDFLQAADTICKANGPDELLSALISILSRQFTTFHTWAALRIQATGPMTSQAGKCRDGRTVELKQIKFQEKIDEAIETGHFFLLPKIKTKLGEEKIHSAMVAPLMGLTYCSGVIYLDNAMGHEHYSLSDLDYLMMLSIHIAAIIENF